MILQPEESFELQGKKAFVINLTKNNLPTRRVYFVKELLNKEVEILYEKYKVVGVESYAMSDFLEHKSVSVLTEKL